MKRVGTLTAAAGLIFLGVWMIISRTNPQLGSSVFNWWPALIILFGLEVLVFGNMREENRRARFNYLIIPIIIVFIFISVFQGMTKWFSNINFEGMGNINDIVNWGENIAADRYKEIPFSGALKSTPKTLSITANNASFDFKKSPDSNIKVEGSVFYPKTSIETSYEINEKVSGEKTTINFEGGNIKQVKLTVYIPNDMNLEVDVNNLKFTSENSISYSKVNINSNNGSMNIANAGELFINCDNAKIDVRNSKVVEIDSNNPAIYIEGNTEKLKIKANNGKVDVRNTLCRDVDITIDNGTVDVFTEDKNLNLEIDLDRGYYSINGERKVNSSITRQFGTGEGRVRIEADNGTVKFSNQE